MPPASSPRQVLVATLTQTIAAAHAAGDLATAQIAAYTLSELLSAPHAPTQVAPVVQPRQRPARAILSPS